METINLQTISIIVGFILTIGTLIIKINQDRFSKLLTFFNKITEIRNETSKIDPYENDAKYKAESLIIQYINLYELISYSVMKNLINEKDTFNLMKKDMKSFYSQNKKRLISLISENKINYYPKLMERWSNENIIKKYVIKNIAIYTLLVILFFSISFIIFR